MHILIAEKNPNGRRMLNQILKMENYEVSVAESGSHAVDLLKEAGPDVVLLNVFPCMYTPDEAPLGKINVRRLGEQDGASTPALLVTCSGGSDDLAGFMSADNQYCDAAFDLLPAKVKSTMMDRIQQMCSALKQSSRMSASGGDFDWQRFSTLMDWNPVQWRMPVARRANATM